MSQIELIIEPRDTDLGDFSVRRVLPFAKRRMVGPFIFLDHMGPAQFAAGGGINVRPHPHIGLATLTYLFEGEILHRDSLGSTQEITPGAVNWMTAGRGIVHSERTRNEIRTRPHGLHGMQFWVALPKQSEEVPPAFSHHPADSLPQRIDSGTHLRVIAGTAFGRSSPVTIYSPLFLVEARMQAGGDLTLAPDYSECAIYVIAGGVAVDGTPVAPLTMAVLTPGNPVHITAQGSAHLMLLGGEPFPEPRLIEWNFVSSDPNRIAAAKQAWRDQLFAKIPGDDQEFIPLP